MTTTPRQATVEAGHGGDDVGAAGLMLSGQE
jgi:hypothetical protein